MSARSEWQQFFRICRVQTEGTTHLYNYCNPRYRDEFAKFIWDECDFLAIRAEWTTAHRLSWYRRHADYLRETRKRRK